MEKEIRQGTKSERVVAAGALLGAIAASSCCVLPLVFVSAGISGAWIGTLTKLAPYQPIFFTLAAGCIAAGFWLAHRRKQIVCAGPACGTHNSRLFTRAALWAGTAILLVAASAGWWARFLA